MASPATATRTTSANNRRSMSSSPSLAAAVRSTPSPSSLVRSPSARSSAPARPSSLSISSARKAAPPLKSPIKETNGIHVDELTPLNGNDALLLSLRRETEEKEELLVKLQNKDQQLVSLQEESDNLTSALNTAEGRLTEVYGDQERMENEMEGQIKVIEKLRAQVRELEKEKREVQRRYNEQTTSFDAERQSFYDNENHLKSRIQSLTQARRQIHMPAPSIISVAGETDVEEEEHEEAEPAPLKNDEPVEDDDPPEMMSLRVELNTLSVSHTSLQTTLQLLQTQLLDLKRVNNELQEENESYNMLLRERTLTGQFDAMRFAGTPSGAASNTDDEDDARSVRSSSAARSVLGIVPEVDESLENALSPRSLEDNRAAGPKPARGSRRGTASPPSRSGDNLGDLPISGPGLDLASELGRAENKDIVEGHAPADDKDRKSKPAREAGDDVANTNDVVTLRNEIKALKDANKALSLYASKILDRIISEEGFEHVLAVDYTADTAVTPRKAVVAPPPPPKKERPQSTSFFSRAPPVELDKISTSAMAAPPVASPPTADVDAKRNRRSFSFDFKGFFGGDKNAPPPTPDAANSLRPLTLRPGATSTVIGNARKLETHEDEEDRRERERLNATMKLMGIDPPPMSPLTPRGPTASMSMQSTASTTSTSTNPEPRTPATTSRFSFFRSRSGTSASTPEPSAPQQPLTSEALERVEAEQTLAQLDMREKELSQELAKGKGSGFTEISPRGSLGDEWRSRRSRKSGNNSESGSTIFSVGKTDADSVRMANDEP